MVSFDLKESHYSAADGALYATPNDEIEFGEKIIQLLDDDEPRHEMETRNRKRVTEKLAWEHTSKELLKAYGWLLGTPGE